jgi:SAM-dependent methyltransferase
MLWPVAVLDRPSQKSFLDVGCGFGFTADAWRTVFSAEAYGCDPAQYAKSGRALLGPHIYHALLDDVPELVGKQFDVVYASEVIEHVPDPIAFVQLLSSRICATGVVTITTPAADFIDEVNDPSTVEAALAPGFHGFLFSRSALESLLRSTGFAHVIVERHNERLIAWASHSPIVRNDTASIVEPYLTYLEHRARRSLDNPSVEQLALRSGYAYRLYKECLLRGRHSNINAQRRLALSDIRLQGSSHSNAEPGELGKLLQGLTPGAKGFGERFRFNLPQVALICGLQSESLDGDTEKARQWFLLSQAATEVLCAHSVLRGLEAAAFFWQAEQRLLQYELIAGNLEEVCRRLKRTVIALSVPHAPIGGSAPSPHHVMALLELVVRALPTPQHKASLFQIARHFAPQSDVSEETASLLRFVETYLSAFVVVAGTSLERSHALRALETATGDVSDRTGTFQSLALTAVASIRAKLQPASFASLASQSWKPTFPTAR